MIDSTTKRLMTALADALHGASRGDLAGVEASLDKALLFVCTLRELQREPPAACRPGVPFGFALVIDYAIVGVRAPGAFDNLVDLVGDIPAFIREAEDDLTALSLEDGLPIASVPAPPDLLEIGVERCLAFAHVALSKYFALV